jgi:hypothetical protein
MVTGIVLGRSCQLPKMAAKAPDGTHPDSRSKRFSRWVQHEAITPEGYYLPFVQALLTNLAALRPLVFVMDATEVGRGCLALMVSVLYGRRALPIAWVVVQGCKGHFPTDTHLALLNRVLALVPDGHPAQFLGDGEFDGIALQQALNARGWSYVCRTAKNTQVYLQGERVRADAMAVPCGRKKRWRGVGFTAANYGPVQVIGWWEAAWDEPLYLVTNLIDRDAACRAYAQRMQVETLFSDQKSRGFHLHKSHLANPERLHHLLIAAALAYLWLIYLGVQATRPAWQARIHRLHRCDLSLFQLGLRLLDYWLNEEYPLPVAFVPHPARRQVLTQVSVR